MGRRYIEPDRNDQDFFINMTYFDKLQEMPLGIMAKVFYGVILNQNKNTEFKRKAFSLIDAYHERLKGKDYYNYFHLRIEFITKFIELIKDSQIDSENVYRSLNKNVYLFTIRREESKEYWILSDIKFDKVSEGLIYHQFIVPDDNKLKTKCIRQRFAIDFNGIQQLIPFNNEFNSFFNYDNSNYYRQLIDFIFINEVPVDKPKGIFKTLLKWFNK